MLINIFLPSSIFSFHHYPIDFSNHLPNSHHFIVTLKLAENKKVKEDKLEFSSRELWCNYPIRKHSRNRSKLYCCKSKHEIRGALDILI